MWEQRAARARLLAGGYEASREVLLFYAGLAEWQGRVASAAPPLETLTSFLDSLLDLVNRTGPATLAQAANSIDPKHLRSVIKEYWAGRDESLSPLDFFARAVLQPYASALPAERECPWCRRPPQVGCLRPQGEGLALDLVCSLCLRRRPFPRGRCPACNESAEGRISLYSAEEFAHLRLQSCDSCRTYLPLVDLSRDPQAIPEVDELAGLPLFLWAAEQGYRKLQSNMAGI